MIFVFAMTTLEGDHPSTADMVPPFGLKLLTALNSGRDFSHDSR
jgi:hypothetical protein